MAKIQDYFLSTKPAKLMLLDAEGEETGDYLEVISFDAAKVSRERSRWTAEGIKIERELKEINDRAEGGETLTEDLSRKSDLITFAGKERNIEFAEALVCGSSFGDVSEDEMRELLSQGNIAVEAINLSADEDRLKKKHK